MRETWYVLEDGTAVHPSEVSVNDKGALAHKLGLVQMRGDTPRSRGVDVDEKPAKAAAPVSAPAAKATADMQPEAKPEPKKHVGYKTRQAKSSR